MKHPDFFTGRTGNRMFQIAYLFSQVKDGAIPDWYVQDYKLFEKYKDEIREMFSEDIGYLPYVAMHVRRGKNPVNPDEPAYSENSFYVNLMDTKYYADAIDQFPRCKFLIFSDDTEYAKKTFEGELFAFDESDSDIESLNKMASCDGIITANSSFSYWAAFLGDKNKKVVAPSVEHWYRDGIERTICPPEWIRL